jgi:hypothetical protein
MQGKKFGTLEKAGCVLVFLMAALQFTYAMYAYIDPTAFSVTRGTELFALGDTDWVKIYASRTLFIALVIGFLLYSRQYRILAFASLFGVVMPVTDALLAYQAQAVDKVVFKHIATAVFLVVTFFVLHNIVKRTKSA